MKPKLIVDARCFQHQDASRRGIGLHMATMLGAREARDFAITLLFDPNLPPPSRALAALGEAATATAYAASRTATLFLQPAPMSFPPRPIERLLRSASVRSLVVVLDFIPHDWRHLYLQHPKERRAYYASLAALRHYDHFLPISLATQARLHEILPGSVGCSDVTGVAMRDSLVGAGADRDFAQREGVLVVAGDDVRKNAEIVVRAAPGGRIRFAGIHDKEMRAHLAVLHAKAGGAPEHLQFLPHLDDAELTEAYGRARLLIAPSRAEGFSMPVIEAMAQGTPVLAADEPAQAELVADPQDRFAPHDATALGARARVLMADEDEWRKVQARQDPVWHRFTVDAVASRFWTPISRLAKEMPKQVRISAVLHDARPRVAFLSPLPPTLSGCADHSAALLESLSVRANVTVFSDTPKPVVPSGIAFGGRAGAMTMQTRQFDAVIAVLGNSEFHQTEIRLLLDYGAAAILHDARLMGFYRAILGKGRACGVAAAELGRDVSAADMDIWVCDEAAMPARFLGEIASSASPLIVHAAETARFIAERHSVSPLFIPFPPYRFWDEAALTDGARRAARERLGIAPDTTLVTSFGIIDLAKEPHCMIEAFGRLAIRRRCQLALVGTGKADFIVALRDHARACGIEDHALLLGGGPVPEALYRDYLAAADVAVQLRRAPPGSISGALMDAAAAGLPSVAGATLVEALDPPAYVQAVPDGASPEVIATAIEAAIDLGRARTGKARRAFLAARGMDRYAELLLEAVLA